MNDVDLRLEGMEIAAGIVEQMPRTIQFSGDEQHILRLAAAEIRLEIRRFGAAREELVDATNEA